MDMNAKPRAKAAEHHRLRPQQKHERNVPVSHHPSVSIPTRSVNGLRGVDLVEQVAQSTVIQRRRWTEAKLDIADTILFMNGIPADWYFTSASTGVRAITMLEPFLFTEVYLPSTC
ncbi:hypothetical protein KRP22_015060 [Phytophthora ramorum]|nr:hypothetical protein KRP22_4842 [Phytophthora ramorum]